VREAAAGDRNRHGLCNRFARKIPRSSLVSGGGELFRRADW
jgi:hypothetical protein